MQHLLTGWRAVGVGALLVVGVLAVGGIGVADISDAVGIGDSPDAGSDAGAAQQGTTGTTAETTTGAGEASTGSNDSTNLTIPVVEAMQAAQNETDGTAVGAELNRDTNVTDLERPTMIYQVDVLLDNDTVVVADVNATDGSVQDVRQSENDTGLLEGLFGSGDDGVPREQANASSIRSAVEAVELVRNETGVNATVTSVQLSEQEGQLRYAVETVSAEGIQSTVIVAANPTEGGVLTTQGEEG